MRLSVSLFLFLVSCNNPIPDVNDGRNGPVQRADGQCARLSPLPTTKPVALTPALGVAAEGKELALTATSSPKPSPVSIHAFAEEATAFQLTVGADRSFDGEGGRNVVITVETAPSKEGPFTQLQTLPVSTHAHADAGRFTNGFYVAPFAFAEPASVVRVKISGIPEDRLNIVKLEAELPIDKTFLEGSIGGYKPPNCTVTPQGFSIIPRSAWTQRGPKAPNDKTTWQRIVVHHSADMISGGILCEQKLRAYLAQHMDANKWNDIGYNFLICPDGRVFEGRHGGKNIMGAHVESMNQNTVGICLIGQYESSLSPHNTPTTSAVDALAKLIAWLSKESQIDLASSIPFPTAKTGALIPAIAYHDFMFANRSPAAGGPTSTDCPGSLIIQKINAGEIKSKAIAFAKAYGNPGSVVVNAPPLAECLPR